jgi:phosphopantetheinyl transferase
MLPDYPTLFAARPLVGRAVRLSPPGLAAPVWFASANAADLKVLSPELFLTDPERARAATFKFGQPRENFTLGRLAGKLALAAAHSASRPLTPALSPDGGEGEALVRSLRVYEIGNSERGEPLVRGRDFQSPALGASLSHVNGCGVAVAFPAGARVGLDFELIDPKRAETVRKGVPLSAEEEAWLKSNALPEATALLLLWTAREALGKALGTGLACKWETLALREVADSGSGCFTGSFLHSPEFDCVSWVGTDAVMSLAFAPT